jgi:hypothetical protein
MGLEMAVATGVASRFFKSKTVVIQKKEPIVGDFFLLDRAMGLETAT